MAQSLMQIDVVSDVICPWCFLGKRRLDKALALIPEFKAEVSFRPFFLDASIPLEGIDRHKYMADKFGEERLKTIHDPLIKAGLEDGVPYAFDKITRTPNSIDAHRLIRWAKSAGRQLQMVDALFCAYWRDGKDVGNHSVLNEIADSVGLDFSANLATDLDKGAVLNECIDAQRLGISGVPTFIVNQKYGISGAQNVETLVGALKEIAAK
jgi:predicted DsbA family dithiol-disulfide isomerase